MAPTYAFVCIHVYHGMLPMNSIQHYKINQKRKSKTVIFDNFHSVFTNIRVIY